MDKRKEIMSDITWEDNIKSYKKSDELLRHNYYENGVTHNRFTSVNNSVITRYKCNASNEPIYSSSQSICSRHLKTHTYQSPFQNESSKDSNIRRKRSIETKISFKEPLEKELRDDLHRTTHEMNYSDKSTYCRPIVNLYNEQFLYKTMEKNSRLKRLVRELMIARQKEKETENWNNYINELRRKHGTGTNMRRATSLQYVPEGFVTPGTIEDYYNTKFTWQQSRPCQNLLHDLYNAHDNFCMRHPFDEYYETIHEYDPPPTKKYVPFKTNPFCYPTSSQGRLIMLERERQKRLTKQRYKPFCNIINEENKPDNTENSLKMTIRNHKNFRTGKSGFVSNSRGTNTMLESSSTQTKSYLNLTNEDVIVDKKKARQVVSKKICTDEIYGVKILQETAQSTENIWKPNSLACIEEKLDNLIHSINSFIVEMKTKTYPRLNNIDLPIKLGKENVNITKSDSYGIGKKEKIVCGLVESSSQSTRYSSKVSSDRFKHMDENIMKMNDILLKEIGRNKVSILKDTSVGETYYPCSVQISVTIPTKEMSTEVTRSLSKAKYNSGNNIDVIEEIDPSIGKNRRMAIAVNTDPLSLLALLKVSTEETLRRLLSYVPSIDYYYYLSRLQSSQSRAIESPFICNICGAAFMKPSELSDHIQKHALGKTRDCCVCRHVLDMPRRRSGLFKCQYCGQRFTRAYCCELHQQSCARRLGMPHDIASSLMLLR